MIAFRVDSSTQIGSGHLMRCLTLAEKLNCKEKIIFISRDLPGNISNLILKKGFKLTLLNNEDLDVSLKGYEKWLTVRQEQDAEETIEAIKKLNIELLILDSYAIDVKWEKMLRPYVKKIMVIDDLANRKHDCDILLDQNYYQDIEIRYTGLVPEYCKLSLGPQYALLRDEFYEERKHLRVRDGIIRRILVFFGGSDQTNETMKAIQALVAIRRTDISVDVVVGGSNKNKEAVKRFCRQHENMNYYCQINNMAELIHKADLAIGAGGSTTWERCCLGLPAIVIAIADNQVEIAKNCAKKNIIIYLGVYFEVTERMLKKEIERVLKNEDINRKMNKAINRFFQQGGELFELQNSDYFR